MPDVSRSPREWADQLIAGIDPAERPALAANPVAAIPRLHGLTLSLVPETEECPLHGIYFAERGSVTVVRTASQGRVRFSALHELGHHLVAETRMGLDFEEAQDPQSLEERVCDAFAAAILLPDELIDQHIPDRGPEASDVMELWEASHASRAAACVAAASRLPSPGYVMLSDLAANALFTAVHRTPFGVRADTPQGTESVPAKAVRNGTSYQGEGVLTFASGSTSPTHQGDARVSGEYVFTVYAKNKTPWSTLNLIGESKPQRAAKPCPRCEEDFVPWDHLICGRCGEHECPHCGECGCQRFQPQQLMCQSCFQTKPAHLFDGEVCSDCSS